MLQVLIVLECQHSLPEQLALIILRPTLAGYVVRYRLGSLVDDFNVSYSTIAYGIAALFVD